MAIHGSSIAIGTGHMAAAKTILNYPRHNGGYKILNIASGFSTYWDLYQIFSCNVKVGSKPLKLFRSRFEVRDESGIPQTLMEQALQHALADHWQSGAEV